MWDCDGILATTITILVPYPIRILGCDWLGLDGLAWAPLGPRGPKGAQAKPSKPSQSQPRIRIGYGTRIVMVVANIPSQSHIRIQYSPSPDWWGRSGGDREGWGVTPKPQNSYRKLVFVAPGALPWRPARTSDNSDGHHSS